MIPDTYISLDEAREELRRRQVDTALRSAIEHELGNGMMPGFKDTPRGGVFKNICSPDNAFTFFLQCSNYVGTTPLFFEYLGDTFSKNNEEKLGLAKLRITNGDSHSIITLFSPHRWNGHQLSEITLQNGTTLVDFHHDLVKCSGYMTEYRDNTVWFKDLGKPSDYYYYFFLHFIAHGVLFEVYTSDEEKSFYDVAIFPNLEKIRQKFGVIPLIVSALPDPNTQTVAEDFYWWSYPPHINDYLLKYAQDNGLHIDSVDI